MTILQYSGRGGGGGGRGGGGGGGSYRRSGAMNAPPPPANRAFVRTSGRGGVLHPPPLRKNQWVRPATSEAALKTAVPAAAATPFKGVDSSRGAEARTTQPKDPPMCVKPRPNRGTLSFARTNMASHSWRRSDSSVETTAATSETAAAVPAVDSIPATEVSSARNTLVVETTNAEVSDGDCLFPSISSLSVLRKVAPNKLCTLRTDGTNDSIPSAKASSSWQKASSSNDLEVLPRHVTSESAPQQRNEVNLELDKVHEQKRDQADAFEPHLKKLGTNKLVSSKPDSKALCKYSSVANNSLNAPGRKRPRTQMATVVKRIKVSASESVPEDSAKTEGISQHVNEEEGNETLTGKALGDSKHYTEGKAVEKLTDFCYREKGRKLVRVTSETAPICPTFLRGVTCTDERCQKRHDVPAEFGMPLCLFFQRQGMCLKDNCKFRHVKVNAQATPCPSFELVGYCNDSSCALMHRRKQPQHAAAASMNKKLIRQTDGTLCEK